MQVRLLGEPELEVAGARVDVGSFKQRALLTALALEPGHPVSGSRLTGLIWGDDPPPSAGETLRSLIYRLRRVVASAGGEPDSITSRGSAYLLDIEPDAIDAHRFDRLSAVGHDAAQAEDWTRAARAWREGLDLWRGPALGDVAELPAMQVIAARLDGARRDLVEELAEADLALGHPGRALAALDPHLADSPLRERAWGARMLALYRLGRQAEALAAYRTLRELLVSELGTEPGVALRELYTAILQQRPELLLRAAAGGTGSSGWTGPPASVRHNLPTAVSAFVGRAEQRTSIGALLSHSRLVTLVGPGGAGKTRLALEIAQAVVENFPDGVWVVELAAVTEPAGLLEAVVAAVALEPGSSRKADSGLQGALVTHLAPRNVLLVIDNCEHQTTAAAQLIQLLLNNCPDLRVLATTRETLAVPGEVVITVDGLSLPTATEPTADDLAQSDAVSLFCQRAEQAKPGFRLTEANAAAVARICRRLDGLPLALELAAPRIRLLSAAQLAASLDDHSALLLGGSRPLQARHATLSATLEWSHGLLTPAEQVALRRLAVFPADFGLAAAVTVIASGSGAPEEASAAFALLSRLVDKSMVTVFHADDLGEPRYRLLETVRQYAKGKLAESGETAAVRDAHCDAQVLNRYWFSECLDGRWLRHAHTESLSVDAALEWCAERGDDSTMLSLVAQQWTYWFFAGTVTGRQWLERAVVVDEPTQVADSAFVRCGLAQWIRTDGGPAERARSAALLRAALAMCTQADDVRSATWVEAYGAQIAAVEGEPAKAQDLLSACAAEFASLGDERAEATCRAVLATASMTSGDMAGSLEQARRAAELVQRNPDSYLAAHTQAQLAVAEATAGQADRATELATYALAAARSIPGSRTLAMALVRAVEVAIILGRPENGRAHLNELLTLLLHTGLSDWVAESIDLAALMIGEGRPEPVVELLAGAVAIRQELGEAGPMNAIAERRDQALTALRLSLGSDQVERVARGFAGQSPRQLLIRALAGLDG